MVGTIIYFHGFASSSDSTKAKLIKKYISKNHRKATIHTPDLSNNFEEAINQIESLIKGNDEPYALYFSQKLQTKAILINPAIPPLDGFDIYLGENENYSTGEKFILTKNDIKFIRSVSHKKFNNHKNILLLVESGDETLNYSKSVAYFKGSNIDIVMGGDHSYSSFSEKLKKIANFIEN
jgi:predicted esterase YcpF (UPF0227 family)